MMRFAVACVLVLSVATAGDEAMAEPPVAVQHAVQQMVGLTGARFQALVMTAFQDGQVEELLAVLKHADEAPRDTIMGRLPQGMRQNLQQMIDDVGDVTPEQAGTAATKIEVYLVPAMLALYDAQVLYGEKKYREAAEKSEAAFKGGVGTEMHYYNAACSWALAGDADAAFRNLGLAREAGWCAVDASKEDEDLVSLHDDPRWEKFVSGMEKEVAGKLESLPEKHEAIEVVKLPEPAKDGEMSVEEALTLRRSIRRYDSAPLTLAEVSQLCWAAYGVSKPIPTAPERMGGGLKTAPSAGATYPLEVYVFAGNVTGLPAGVYKYRTETHELLLLKEGDLRAELSTAALGQSWVRDAPMSLVYSAVFERTTGRYGTRGRERYVCMDLGHSAGNVCLQVPTLGLGTVPIGAFIDEDVKVVTGMTKIEEPLYIMPVGRLKE